MSGRRLTGTIFVIIALANFAFAGAAAFGRYHEVQGYRPAEAVVIDTRDAAPVRPGKPLNPAPAPAPPSERGAAPFVRFVTAEGRAITARLDSGLFLDPPQPGSGRIAVLYDPADLKTVTLDHPLPLYEPALVVAAAGLPFLLFGVKLRSATAGAAPAAAAPAAAAPSRLRRAAAAWAEAKARQEVARQAAAQPAAGRAEKRTSRAAAGRSAPAARPAVRAGEGLLGASRETAVNRTGQGPTIVRGGERGLPTVLLAALVIAFIVMLGALAVVLHHGGTGIPV